MINPWSATLSVNAGLALNTDGLRIWVDAVHDQKVMDFSTLMPQMQRQLFENEAFENPDVIAFTHCHPDHFSKSLCLEAMERYPDARLILPEQQLPRQTLISGNEMMIRVAGRLLTFRRLTHQGPEYRNVPHYGLMVEDGGEHILVLGDCELCSYELQDWVRDYQIDTVFATFPWVTLPQGRRFIQDVLRPKCLFVYHLPLQKDDLCHYRAATEKWAKAMEGVCQVRLLTEAFQQEQF